MNTIFNKKVFIINTINMNTINNLMDNNIPDTDICEEIAKKPTKWNNLRCCRSMTVPDDIADTQRGELRVLITEGGGYFCQWYYYRTFSGNHMLIFRSPNGNNTGFTFSGRGIDELPENFGNQYDSELDF